MFRKSILLSFVTLMILFAASAADAVQLGHWRLDEGAGTTAFDSSGAGNHGTIVNPNGGLGPGRSVWDTDGDHGTVLSFNGDDAARAYVSAGSIPAMGLTTDFTWAFWARQDGDGTGVNQIILGNRGGGTASPLQFIKFILEPQRTGNSKQSRQIRKIWKNAVWGYEPVILFKKCSTPHHFGRELCSRQPNPILAQKKGVFKILAFNTINRVPHP